MPKKKKNRPPKPVVPEGRLAKQEPPKGNLLFSFRYVDVSNEKFRLSRCKDGYLDKLVERLQEISRHLTTQLQSDQGLRRVLRSHSFEFSRSTEPAGFIHVRPPDMWAGREWQFSISVNEHGRIHGFIDGDVFYVVWFDPDHLLDPKRA